MNFTREYRDFVRDDPVYQYPPGMLNIVNVVSTYFFNKEIDIERILEKCDYACVKMLAAVKLCITPPRVAVYLFNTENATLIGAQNEFVARDSAEIFTHSVKRAMDDWELRIMNFNSHNYTVTSVLPFKVNLPKLARERRYVFKSDFFPLYEIVLPDTKVRCSTSETNIIITGVRCDEHCEQYFRIYLDFLAKFQWTPEELAEEEVIKKTFEEIDFDALELGE